MPGSKQGNFSQLTKLPPATATVTRKSGLAFLRHLPSPPYPATSYTRVVVGNLIRERMSVDLKPIGNHDLNFNEPSRQCETVLKELNSILLDNDFIFYFQKKWYEGREDFPISQVDRIKWRVNQHTVKENQIGVMFMGDYYLRVFMCRHTIGLYAPFRYNILEQLEDPDALNYFMNWRNFWSSLVTGLGGNKIAYLSDSGFDKYVEHHWDNYPMDTIITELKTDLGEPGTLDEFINGKKEKRYILDRLT